MTVRHRRGRPIWTRKEEILEDRLGEVSGLFCWQRKWIISAVKMSQMRYFGSTATVRTIGNPANNTDWCSGSWIFNPYVAIIMVLSNVRQATALPRVAGSQRRRYERDLTMPLSIWDVKNPDATRFNWKWKRSGDWITRAAASGFFYSCQTDKKCVANTEGRWSLPKQRKRSNTCRY